MFATLLLPLLVAGPTEPLVSPNDPPIELWISNDRRFVPGEDVQVHVRSQESGYLIVLHADPAGRVRVLFPLDPQDDHFIRGGKRYEVRGRGDRRAFETSITGQGMVYAAVSKEPFQFSRYIAADHWDYGALAPDPLPREPEAELTELVRNMAQSGFDYDVLTYDVSEREYVSDYWYRRPYHYHYADRFCDPFYYDYYCRPYGSYLSIRFVFGSPYYRSYYPYYPYRYSYYDPFFYRPVYPYPVYRYPVYTYPVRRHTLGSYPRGPSRFDDYRDRRFTFSRVNADLRFTPGAASPLAPARRVEATPTRRVVEARAARPARRSVYPTPAPRPTIEARRAREPEPRVTTDPRPARPEAQGRRGPTPQPSREEPEARRAEPSRDVRPPADRGRSEARRAEPERADRVPPRAESERAERGDREPRRAEEPSDRESRRAAPRRAEPDRAEPNRPEPRRAESRQEDGERGGGRAQARGSDRGGEARPHGGDRPAPRSDHGGGHAGGRRR